MRIDSEFETERHGWLDGTRFEQLIDGNLRLWPAGRSQSQPPIVLSLPRTTPRCWWLNEEILSMIDELYDEDRIKEGTPQ